MFVKKTDNISMFNMTDYSLVYLPRSCCGHGGLMFYVHHQFKCTPNNHKIMKKATHWEYLCVEMSHQKHNAKNLSFLIYIIENQLKYSMSLMFFLEEFRSFLIFIINENHPSYLCGDYNIDLLKIKIKKSLQQLF